MGKAKKKKWSKGKVKEKLANLVLFDKPTYDKMLVDVPKLKLITPSIISEKLKVNGSRAQGRQGARVAELDPADPDAQAPTYLHPRNKHVNVGCTFLRTTHRPMIPFGYCGIHAVVEFCL